MATSKIKKGDLVRVIAGKDAGKEGKVTKVDLKNHKVLVEGVNMVFKHSKPNMANQAGGIIEKELPIDISNVMLLEGSTPVRTRKLREAGKKAVRVSVKTGKAL